MYFLGTGGSTPFGNSNMPCTALKHKRDLVIFDMGEGSQFSLIHKGLHPARSNLIILLTHFHADHTAGLPGLLHTLSISGNDKPVYIAGPRGLRAFFEHVSKAFLLERLPFDVKLLEIHDPTEQSKFLERERYFLKSFPTKHTRNSIGYVFQEKDIPGEFNEEKAETLGIPPSSLRAKLKRGESVVLSDGRKVRPEEVVAPPRDGRAIVYTGDTRPTEHTLKHSHNASFLIHDGAFLSEDIEKAKEKYHSTIGEGLSLAKRAKVKAVAFIHRSSRYKGEIDRIRQEAKENAREGLVSLVPEDGDKVTIRLDRFIVTKNSEETETYKY